MRWNDEAVILKLKLYGENKALVTSLTKNYGKISGFTRLTKKNKTMLQAGNIIQLNYSARLEEHLGSVTCEPVESLSYVILSHQKRLLAIMSACALLEACLPEKNNEAFLFQALINLRHDLKNENWLKHYVLFEKTLLEQLGYGFDFTRCAVTGVTNNLKYISPKTGAVVCEEIGRDYNPNLFEIPKFFLMRKLKQANMILKTH